LHGSAATDSKAGGKLYSSFFYPSSAMAKELLLKLLASAVRVLKIKEALVADIV